MSGGTRKTMKDLVMNPQHLVNQKYNMETLEKSTVPYEVTNDGFCCVFRVEGRPRCDFYPTTNRWRDVDAKISYKGTAQHFLHWYETRYARDSSRGESGC